jgi:hypothetical protein
MVGADKCGEMAELPWGELRLNAWLGSCFAQTELVRSAWFLRRGMLYTPGRAGLINLRVTSLGKLGTLGPDRRDIYDGFEFSPSMTNYPALWGHAAEDMQTFAAQPNRWLSPLAQAAEGRPPSGCA